MPTEQLDIRTVAEHVVAAMRELIVSGELPPESPLRLAELSDRLGVSATPVRNALARLEAERLVWTLPRRGAIVAPLRLDDLEEIQAVRSGVEGLAARLGAPRVTVGAVAKMRKLLDRLVVASENNAIDAYISHQWDLYDMCYRCSERPRLLQLITEHRRRAERYIRIAVGQSGGFANPLGFHGPFVEACASQNGRAAEEFIREALWWVVDALAPQLSEDGSPRRS